MAKLSQKPGHYLQRDKYATRAETVQKILDNWKFTSESQLLPIAEAAGRISAEDLFSHNTLPVCRAAGGDGVAVRFEDFENGIPDFSKWKENVDYAPADMGDDFDDRFDTVLWVEEFTFDEEGKILGIEPEEPVKKGQLVKQKGDTLEEKEQVIRKGDVINPFRVGLLAAAGVEKIAVIRKPKIVYLPTGSELVPAGQVPGRGQNIESNSLMTASLCTRWGADVQCMPIVEDQKMQLEMALDEALKSADIVLLNGGTSMGTEDYTSSLLQRRASHFQHGVRCIPGVPVATAIVDKKPVVNLPGPPYAAFCALDWCVRAFVYHWYGQPLPKRQKVKARLKKAVQKPETHEMYIRVIVEENEQTGYTADPMLMNVRFAEASKRWNGLFIAPIGGSQWEYGSEIDVELLYTDC